MPVLEPSTGRPRIQKRTIRDSPVQNGPYPHALIMNATVPNATRRMIPEYHLNAKQETRPSHHKNEKDIMTE